jgi:hypothetical protein
MKPRNSPLSISNQMIIAERKRMNSGMENATGLYLLVDLGKSIRRRGFPVIPCFRRIIYPAEYALTMSSAHQFTLLELLPNEILYMVVQLLCMYDVGHLAFTSNRLREVCIPYLFRNVRFSFSSSGFGELRRLLLSDVRQNVVSFTYVIPELLRPGKSLSVNF